jgi:hypothetical protein
MQRRTLLVLLITSAVTGLILGFPASNPLVSEASAQSCRELRKACLMKDELGEQGQGNCRRYRDTCQGSGGGGMQQTGTAPGGGCEVLRQLCLHKDDLGMQGMGNCRRYRDTCQGGQ